MVPSPAVLAALADRVLARNLPDRNSTRLTSIPSSTSYAVFCLHKKNPHLIQQLFNLNENNPSLPIEELDKKTPLKRHDVVVFEFKKGMGPNHVGVYLGNDTFHHHPRTANLSATYKEK